MTRSLRGLGALFVVLSSCLITTPSWPLLGNLGKGLGVPCLVACGDKGIVNPNFLGDAVNTQLTQASIDKFEEAGVRVVNLADQKLNAALSLKIDQVNTLLQARLADLNADITAQRQALVSDLGGISRQLISELDDVFKRNLSDGDILLEARFGNINTIAENQAILFKKLFQQLIIVGAALFVLIYVGLQVLKIDFSNLSIASMRSRTFLQAANVRAASVRFIAVSLFTFIAAASGYRLVDWFADQEQSDLQLRYEEMYDRRLNEFNFRYAQYYASQLQVLDPSNEIYEALNNKAGVLRTSLASPYSFSNPSGFAELVGRIKRVENVNAKLGRASDPDMATIAAYIMWQRGSDQLSRYAAASLAAQTLRDNAGKEWPTKALARHYVAMYSASPVRDDFLRSANFKMNEENEALASGEWASAIKTFRYLTNEEIDKIYRTISEDVADIDPSVPFSPLIYYGRIYTLFEKSALSAYTSMVLAHYRSGILVGDEQSASIKLRNESAQALVLAFDEFFGALRNPLLDETNLRQRSITGLFAYYLRAKHLLSGGDAAPVLPLAAPPSLADVGSGMHQEWINTFVVGIVQPSTASFIEAAVKFDVAEEQKKLSAFEAQIAEFFASVKNAQDLGGSAVEVAKAVDVARRASISASELQLIVCSNGTAKVTFGVCSSFDGKVEPAALAILSYISGQSILANFSGWADVQRGYLGRRYSGAT